MLPVLRLLPLLEHLPLRPWRHRAAEGTHLLLRTATQSKHRPFPLARQSGTIAPQEFARCQANNFRCVRAEHGGEAV